MILDTNAVSALFAGDVALEELLAAEPLHHVPVIVIGEYRRAGRPIPENDLWIAALARQYQQRIVSRDQHFDAIDPSLRVIW